MFAFPEPISAATRTQLESQFALANAFASKTFEGLEKIVDLNLNVLKASLEESTAAAQQLLAVKDPQEFFAMSAAQAQPAAEKAFAYGRHLNSIATTTQAEFAKAAEERLNEANHKAVALVEEISKNAPPGSENTVNLVKAALGNASAGYEQFTKTAKQAVETMETNLNNAGAQFTQAAGKAAGRSANGPAARK